MRPIVLSGFMGTGKSTVGPRLAARLGVPFIDTDEEIARTTGSRISDLWRTEGEAAFRRREVELVERLLADVTPRVLAFGGGTVTSRRARHRAIEAGIVVTLSATPETIVARVGAALDDRPNLLLGGDPIARARDLLEQRAEAYAECHATLATDARDPDSLVDAILAVVARDPIAVPLGARSYVVDVVHGAPAVLTDAIAQIAPSSLVVVTDAHVHRERHGALDVALAPLALRRTLVTLPAGEAHKTIASVATIWDAALGAGLDREALVLGFGGGVVGDLAGFAAASLLRGVRTLMVPTTLLAMVDASVGGKTGFDHPTGKNLIGAFHQPTGVVVDLAHLSTLPARERTAGLAEVVKIGLTSDAGLLDRLEADASRLAKGDPEALMPIVRRAVEAKVRVVRDDEREQGLRAVLNLGHTLGHALEAHGRYQRHLHGEAVAIGTLLELGVTAHLGWTPPALVERARDLCERLGLATRVPAAEVAASWSFVLVDKKRATTRISLPVVTGPGQCRLERVTLDSLRQATLAVA